ncbi:hypothetical protein ACJMK2_027875 [Sinanodonta woodiana]|uniref:Guanine nucleotide-binding protein subunit beta-like protein 1 n=1 Tax=Sinanodonta woodiana TaxID=1069815 RepID=A0ABD3X7F9_SINWO
MATESRNAPPNPRCILRGVGVPVTYLTFPHDPDHLYAAGENGFIHLWDMKRHRIKFSLEAHKQSSILWMGIKEESLLTQGRDGVMKIWSVTEAGWNQTGCLKCGDLGFCRGTILSIDNSSKWIGVSSQDYSQLDLYDLRTRKNIGCLKHSGGKNKVGMIMVLKCRQKQNEEASQILIGYEDGSITLWDIRTYKLISEAKVHTESLMCMDYSNTANKGISGSTDNKLCTWTVQEESQISVTDTIQMTNPGFNDILIRTDDKVFGVAGWDKQVRIFGLKKNKPLALLSYHRENVQCLAYAQDLTFACGSRDSLISIWDIYKENT